MVAPTPTTRLRSTGLSAAPGRAEAHPLRGVVALLNTKSALLLGRPASYDKPRCPDGKKARRWFLCSLFSLAFLFLVGGRPECRSPRVMGVASLGASSSRRALISFGLSGGSGLRARFSRASFGLLVVARYSASCGSGVAGGALVGCLLSSCGPGVSFRAEAVAGAGAYPLRSFVSTGRLRAPPLLSNRQLGG